MILFKTLLLKNFLSIGNVTQTINFTSAGLTLILGENIDLGGNSSRNGVGKTGLLNALSFAIYGLPLVNIKKDHLVNNTNQKGMSVTLEYSDGNKKYRIERGRKPNFLRYFIDDGLVSSPESDESAGENKWTQVEIERSLSGMSHTLFKHIIALHTKMIPFLSLREKDQREIIEELLGITQLSKKADQLKEQVKTIKDELRDEEIRIKTTLDSNDKIQKHISDLKFKSQLWEREHNKKIDKINESIESFQHIDIEEEIKAHKIYDMWTSLEVECNRLEAEANKLKFLLQKNKQNSSLVDNEIEQLRNHNCPTCGSALHDSQQSAIEQNVLNRKTSYESDHSQLSNELTSLLVKLEKKLTEMLSLGTKPTRAYKTLEEALNYRHKLDKLCNDVIREQSLVNPYFDQIANLASSGLQVVSYDYLNGLFKLKEHQDFLFKLLTGKESFIRKRIIDQNLSYLNHKLNKYLQQLQLPHEVVFQSDLTVEILNFGKEYDFEQLSNGEANRLILALSWAFRDTWESMNTGMNILMIDELIDQGMDRAGTDSALDVLKSFSLERNRNVFIISHTENLESKVDNILLVQKENNFTSFSDLSLS